MRLECVYYAARELSILRPGPKRVQPSALMDFLHSVKKLMVQLQRYTIECLGF